MQMTAGTGETPREHAHHVADPLIEVDVATELMTLRASDSYRAANHAAKTIAKQPGIRVVLIAFKTGGRMDEHHAKAAITVHALEGQVEFAIGEMTATLRPGSLLTVGPGVPHSVTATADSAVLLTIGGEPESVEP
jgi:quercetin dioxygenase-like cupin family protein